MNCTKQALNITMKKVSGRKEAQEGHKAEVLVEIFFRPGYSSDSGDVENNKSNLFWNFWKMCYSRVGNALLVLLPYKRTRVCQTDICRIFVECLSIVTEVLPEHLKKYHPYEQNYFITHSNDSHDAGEEIGPTCDLEVNFDVVNYHRAYFYIRNTPNHRIVAFYGQKCVGATVNME